LLIGNASIALSQQLDAFPQVKAAEYLPVMMVASAAGFLVAVPMAFGAMYASQRWYKNRQDGLTQPFIEVSQ